MLLDVVFSPTEIALALEAQPQAACAVIDVVRATTTLTVLGEGGASRVFVAADINSARNMRGSYPQALLVGEVDGLAPVGFDFSNTPSLLGQQDVREREIIFATTNGTRAMQIAQQSGAGSIYAASLRNAQAIADLAVEHDAFCLLCAGLHGRVALDDLYTAGVIAAIIAQRAEKDRVALTLTEGATMSVELAANAGEPLAVLQSSQGGRNALAIEMGADLAWCAAVNASAVIPHMTGVTSEGALIFTFDDQLAPHAAQT